MRFRDLGGESVESGGGVGSFGPLVLFAEVSFEPGFCEGVAFGVGAASDADGEVRMCGSECFEVHNGVDCTASLQYWQQFATNYSD